MSQRVNIQYSVKIDDLEEEVQRLANKAYSVLEASVSNSKHLKEIGMTVDSHCQVDDTRIALSEVDAILADVNMIIGSFLTYKSQQMIQSVQRPPNPMAPGDGEAEPSAVIPEYSELQEKLASFKSKLENVDTGDASDADIR